MSDHGDHRMNRYVKHNCSGDEMSRKVLTVLTSGPFDEGGTLSHLVDSLKLTARLLDVVGPPVVGTPVPAASGRRSLLRLVRCEPVGWRDELFLQVSDREVGRDLRTRRWEYGVTAPDDNLRADPASSCFIEPATERLSDEQWQVLDGELDA